MDISILRINKSTAKRAHIILLLPFVLSVISVKTAISAAVVSALFIAISYIIYVLCEKYLSIVISYPVSIVFLGMLSFVFRSFPDFWGFSIGRIAVPSLFLALFMFKYIGAKDRKNKVELITKKYSLICVAVFVSGTVCEILSRGTIFDIRIIGFKSDYFATYSGLLLILAFIAALVNVTMSEKISINRSFYLKRGSVRLIAYSTVTSLVIVSFCKLADNLLLSRLSAQYLCFIIICFFCGIAFIAYRLIDKKIHIGKHAANVAPSISLLLSVYVCDPTLTYKHLLLKLAFITVVFIVSVYICELLSKRSSTIDANNPFSGAPSTLLLFSIAALVMEHIKTLASI